MKLPNRKNAYIPKEKLTDYILSETHSGGKSKAKFFRSVGFNETNTSLLEKFLLSIAITQEVKDVSGSIHGNKYVIEGKINTPSKKIVKIRSIWILEPDQKAPRFVTAYPV
ncbi:MAG: hypothetical protein HYT07_00230 [Candidatus Levybacteria bacterium]|nr:hypothetical protein [Candidatus Levybacteria bacterium]